MSGNYIPLYRKYRPQTLDTLVGQEHIKKTLTSAIELGKISHAYLFTGPRGTGKTSTARILAKSLNCKNGPTVQPCGECESCKDITNSIPIDVIEIDAASNRKVEDTQSILEKIQYVPVNGKYKIYIIDEVHMLTNHAFNALLKTLEEPPENVIFILATTEVHKVLDTIKSRCQRFDFRRITTDDIVKHLRYISDEENIDITDETITNTARVWEGTQAEYNALTPAEKVGIVLFLITDSIGTGVVVDDTVEDGNLNAVTSNAVYDAIQTLGGKAIEYVASLPVTGIKDKIYGLEEQGSNPKFYAGDEDNQATYKLGGSDIFTGTQAEWNALTTAEKNEYSQANITDANSTVFIPVDVIADGNMNPVTSNAVYDALPTFEQYILPLTYTVAAGAVVEIETTISWSNDIIVIPRWLGSTEIMLANYYNSNNKVKIGLKNVSSSAFTITDANVHLSVIRSKVSWS